MIKKANKVEVWDSTDERVKKLTTKLAEMEARYRRTRWDLQEQRRINDEIYKMFKKVSPMFDPEHLGMTPARELTDELNP